MAQWDSLRSLSDMSMEDNSSEYLLADYFGQGFKDPYEEEDDLVEVHGHHLVLYMHSSNDMLTSLLSLPLP
jgi:hypothetical protein